MIKSYVRTATRSTLKVEANLTQILNFKSNFHTEFEPFFKKKIYANNGGHFNPLVPGLFSLKSAYRPEAYFGKLMYKGHLFLEMLSFCNPLTYNAV